MRSRAARTLARPIPTLDLLAELDPDRLLDEAHGLVDAKHRPVDGVVPGLDERLSVRARVLHGLELQRHRDPLPAMRRAHAGEPLIQTFRIVGVLPEVGEAEVLALLLGDEESIEEDLRTFDLQQEALI